MEGPRTYVYIYIYISEKIVNNGTQVWHDGDASPSDVYKRLVLASPEKSRLNWQLSILFIPSSSRAKRELETLGVSCMLCA